MFKVQVFDKIAAHVIKTLEDAGYEVGSDINNPDAVLVRSHQLHNWQFPDSVKVVGRAGIGVNNIPIPALTEKGIPVLNTPGANANAVKELVIAGMLLASRQLCNAWNFVKESTAPAATFDAEIERQKKLFVGSELAGKTLGVVGLGNIGVSVANAGLSLGMSVIGFDPYIAVKNALALSSNAQVTDDLNTVLKKADYISLHIPLIPETKAFLDANGLAKLKPKAVLLNFSRGEIVDTHALTDWLAARPQSLYVTDFPIFELREHPQVINLPHLGASTYEAEENCAKMIIQLIRNYLELGHLSHSVNFPECYMPSSSDYRIAIANKNIPGMVAHISEQLGQANINIAGMMNKSRGDIAYTLIDVASKPTKAIITDIAAITGVIKVNTLFAL